MPREFTAELAIFEGTVFDEEPDLGRQILRAVQVGALQQFIYKSGYLFGENSLEDR